MKLQRVILKYDCHVNKNYIAHSTFMVRYCILVLPDRHQNILILLPGSSPSMEVICQSIIVIIIEKSVINS